MVSQSLIIQAHPKVRGKGAIIGQKINCASERCMRVGRHCRVCVSEAQRLCNPLIQQYLLTVHVRIKNNPKTGEPRALAVGTISCSLDMCARMKHQCRNCIEVAKASSTELIEDFYFREKFDNAGANHLRGDYIIPGFS